MSLSFDYLNPSVFCVPRIEGKWSMNFPLAHCNLVCIYKSQGSTYLCMVRVHLVDFEIQGGSFVAFNRVKKFEQLCVNNWDVK